jgi:thiol-disulfide isomerase/thioredoxin
MKKKVILIFMIFLATIVFAQKRTISGKISGFKNGDKILLDNPEIMKFIDSSLIVNDKFVMKNNLSEVPKNLYLTIKSEGKFYSTSIFIANENVVINGDKKDFPYNLKISGSEHEDKASLLKAKTKMYEIERDEIVAFLRAETKDTSEIHKNMRKKYVNRMHEIDKVTDSIKISYIKSNLNSYSAINELFYLRSEYEKGDLQKKYNSLQTKYKNSIYGEKILNYLKVGEILKEGDLFCDFEAKDQFGINHKFSEFTGNFILLDFTETYCAACIASTKELKKVFENHSEKLKIVSFCADKSDLIWKKGLDRDIPNWLSLWDGKGTSGKTLMKYGIQGYPTFFLIDPNGKIININIGYSEQSIENMIRNNVK